MYVGVRRLIVTVRDADKPLMADEEIPMDGLMVSRLPCPTDCGFTRQQDVQLGKGVETVR